MKQSFIVYIFLILFVCSICCSCSNTNNEYEKSDIAMGTFVSIKVHCGNGEEALNKAFEKLVKIEKMMSSKLEDSELTKLNNNAYNEPVVVSDELYYVIEKAIYYSELSEGAFDPTIGNIIDMWNIGSGEEKVLNNEDVIDYIGLKNYNNIVLNNSEKTIKFNSDKIKLDLGAIVKGYAADEIKKMLISDYNVKSGIINLGGNIVVIGNKTDGSMWNVGVQDPKNKEKLLTTVNIKDKTVVTSGNYERYFVSDGIIYHHIINPYDGFPADNGVISTTIISDNSMEADALSTATYILGVDKSMELINKLEGVEAILVKDNGEVITIK